MSLEALEAAVSDALSAATEGSDCLEAPEPSDEPGSPYVRAIAAILAAAGVGFAAPSCGHPCICTPEGHERLARVIRNRSTIPFEYRGPIDAWHSEAAAIAAAYAGEGE